MSIMRQPNFLYIMTDQHRADWLGCYGHPIVNTPNIDQIAQQGAKFTNFHVASPVCMPNRASFLTGRMPSVHGLRYNGCYLSERANTFVDVLAAGGYRTASFGKSHLQPFLATPPLRAESNESLLIEEAWRSGYLDPDQEQPEHYAGAEKFNIRTPYYGFQHVDMVTAHGDRCGGHYQQWFREQCADWQVMHDDSNQLSHNYSCPQAYRTPIPETLYPTRYIADRTVEWLQNYQHHQPFFAFVTFPDPHHPFNPPGKYWDMYSPDEFDITLPFDEHKNPTPPMQWLTDNWRNGGKQLTQQTAMRVDNQHIKEAMALTAGMITMVDDEVGRIVDALKATGQFDNTVIIFNSDHGDYLGDFNLLLKGPMPFKSITRVPMLWSDPQSRSATSHSSLASTIDIAPSVLERAGLQPYRGVQGRSFLATLRNSTPQREDLLVEYNDGAVRLGLRSAARVRSLHTVRWRYTVYGGESWGELYDLQNDSDETHNLWDSPAHQDTKAALSLQLNHQLIAQMDESPVSTRLA
ncbi:sulfatase [Chromatiales bacterium (ex Bugula neritina AB1)]|nr:sulfatase [Chromatiales bacterium (ex Bugula neritina AB1)]